MTAGETKLREERSAAGGGVCLALVDAERRVRSSGKGEMGLLMRERHLVSDLKHHIVVGIPRTNTPMLLVGWVRWYRVKDACSMRKAITQIDSMTGLCLQASVVRKRSEESYQCMHHEEIHTQQGGKIFPDALLNFQAQKSDVNWLRCHSPLHR